MMATSTTKDGYLEGNNDWRLTLVRALINGDLEIVERDIMLHLDAMSKKITTEMETWKLELETIYWWELQSATPVFIASVFAHPQILKWLIDRGAERHEKCYLGQTALDLVGERSKNVKEIEECRQLLLESPKVPFPPQELMTEAFIDTQQVTRRVQVPEETKTGALRVVEKTIHEEVHKCTVQVRWLTPLSNGAIIEKYEVRCRVYIPGKTSASDPIEQDPDVSPKVGEYEGDDRGWRINVAIHSRVRNLQGIAIENLTPGIKYQFSSRSQNRMGKGSWSSPSQIIELPTVDYDYKQ